MATRFNANADTTYYGAMRDMPTTNHESDLIPLPSPKRALTPSTTSRIQLPLNSGETMLSWPLPIHKPSVSMLEANTKKLGPFLDKASSVLSRKQYSSPHRRSQTHGLIQTPLQASSNVSSAQSVAQTSMEDVSRGPGTKASRAAVVFADFFQGSSELVSGFSINSKRIDENYTRLRPGHSRKNSAASVAANFFGRNQSAKVVKSEQELDEQFLRIDIDRELFPSGESKDLGIADYDELKSNAERLFMQMQMAFESKMEALQQERRARIQQQDELEMYKTQAEHLKIQMRGMSDQANAQDEKFCQLEEELKQERRWREIEKQTRMRSVRLVQEEPVMTFAGLDGKELTLDDSCSSDEDSRSGSMGGSNFWSRPGSPSYSQSDLSEAEGAIDRLIFGSSGSLREENAALKARVAELEAAVEGCLGLVERL